MSGQDRRDVVRRDAVGDQQDVADKMSDATSVGNFSENASRPNLVKMQNKVKKIIGKVESANLEIYPQVYYSEIYIVQEKFNILTVMNWKQEWRKKK